ncbi:MAG: cell division FtsA domain-containing protein [Oscillospiraceae bacterium]|nr:cell division FtsA domain-containing protein [Oscillospiraceae bacterium]MDY6209197.1 cell division FtsA domain-containing protein [Oscillospiraceae bacterium]
MPKSKAQGASVIRKAQKSPQGENDIFALDIGTRNVVGVIGHMEDGVFTVSEAVSVPHKRRAMLDGQIEDIVETSRIVSQVKAALEEKAEMTLSKVAIAAAGRALKTKRASVETELDGRESITENMLKSLELEAVAKAQSELDSDSTADGTTFYCVGHTVIKYALDDYPIKSLLGHKGKKVEVELIAAFLPSLVVESLYTVMDMNGLDVCSLTLEPIAAMNVIIPPEVRLINIALVDIGAGTTDIAVSRNGSIVAYAMATIAGDEITEDIIQKYLVDFETAENMKLTPPGEDVSFTDILGFEHTIKSDEFFSGLFPAVDQLADTIADNILEANGSAPAAVFLVGGGSLIPELTSLVAEKLEIPENRVAIGGQNYRKNINLGKMKITGPEFVTPIGIGITATLQKGYEFSQVTLNGGKFRIFDTKTVTAADLLMNAGFQTPQIIGKSGRGLVFILNGEKQSLRGETSTPAQIMVNGLPATLEYTVKPGDDIEFTPATVGANAAVTVSDIAGEVFTKKIIIDGEEYTFGRTVRANGAVVSGNYSVQNYDNIEIESIETLGDLIMSLPFDCSGIAFFKNDRLIREDYVLEENDAFVTKDKHSARENLPNAARDIALKDEKASRTVQTLSGIPMTAPEPAPAEPSAEPESPSGSITVTLNGRPTRLEARTDNSPHEFIELMALADIDISDPPPSGNMILTLNGQNASFMDVLHEGDSIVIKWET